MLMACGAPAEERVEALDGGTLEVFDDGADVPADREQTLRRDANDVLTDIGHGRVDAGVRCPPEMQLVSDRVCVDRWEDGLVELPMEGGVRDWSPYESVEGHIVRAVSRAGAIPQGYISGEQSAAACANAGKRLCALEEWMAACQGPAGLVYPYGDTYVHGRCNEGRAVHPVVEFYGTDVGVWTYADMNNPGINMQANTVTPAGDRSGCVSPWGIYDLVGNMDEWIDDPAGTFKGGYYVDAETNGHGCAYITTAHDFTYHDYSTGFRCCRDPNAP